MTKTTFYLTKLKLNIKIKTFYMINIPENS